MSEINQITVGSTTYDIEDSVARDTLKSSLLFGKDGLPIIDTKTYTNVIATSNDNVGGGFFYLKVRPTYYSPSANVLESKALWHVKTRVIASVPGQSYYYTDTIFDIWGRENTYCLYSCTNQIYATSYRPIYYNSVFFTNSTGYNNNCGHWIGFNLWYSTNPTSTSYKRQITVELLAYDNCTVELQDSLITPTNIPNRAAHTDWYTSTDTSFSNFDACNCGLKQYGDANTTSIHALYESSGNYIADSSLYRYQLLFQKDENTLTPLNNNNNATGTTKTMLTNVEFDPFGRIYYYSTTTTVSAGAAIGAGALYFHYAGVDTRYTFNCGTTLTAHAPFYLVVTPTSNGKCKIASTTPWAQTLPSTNDGNWYILLGRTYSTYQFTLYEEHPIYYYDGTSVQRVLPIQSLVTSVNGQTGAVNIAVPSTAADVGAVPTTRKVNNKALSSDITLTAADVGALASTYTAPVSSVNGQTGAVTLAIPSSAADVGAVPTTRKVNNKALSADITLAASDVGAVPTSRTVNGKPLNANITLTAADVSAVPTTRKVNNKALSSDITLTAADVGALASTYTAPVTSVNSQTGAVSLSIPSTAADVGAVPTSRKINNKTLSSDITLAASDVGAVPTTRKVNNKTLSSDITLSAADVGALPSTYTAPVSSVNSQTGAVVLAIPSKAADVGAVPSTHTVVRLYGVTCNANSAVGDFATVNNAAISSNHVVANIVFNDPAQIRSDVIWVTTTGNLTLNGRCYAATAADIILVYNDVLVS